MQVGSRAPGCRFVAFEKKMPHDDRFFVVVARGGEENCLKPARTILASLLVVALVALVALSRHASSTHVDKGTRSGLYATHVRFLQTWESAGILRAEARGAFMVRTNLGYEVRVDKGFLVDTSASLVDCEGPGGDVWEKATRRSSFGLGSLFEGVAYAGHLQAPDPSNVAHPTVTDFVSVQGQTTFGESRFPEARYCHVHFLVAGGAGPSAYTATFPDVDTTRTTLYVRGAWRKGEGTWNSLELRSKSADGVLLDLPPLVDGPMKGTDVTVTIARRLATMFDDIELALESRSEVLAKSVLRNLDRKARVLVSAH
jgi:hypothetical protein